MTKEQYIRVIERVINSPRNDYQKIIMLQQGFELYVAESKDIKDDVIKNLYTLFDAAFEENMNGRGTDITRMVTTFVPDAIQNLQAYEDMFKNLSNKVNV